jgi:hypothetical protein
VLSRSFPLECGLKTLIYGTAIDALVERPTGMHGQVSRLSAPRHTLMTFENRVREPYRPTRGTTQNELFLSSQMTTLRGWSFDTVLQRYISSLTIALEVLILCCKYRLANCGNLFCGVSILALRTSISFRRSRHRINVAQSAVDHDPATSLRLR